MHDYATCAAPINGWDKLELRSLTPQQAERFLLRTDLGIYAREEATARLNGCSLSRKADRDG